jgi:hypothetical protein
VKGTDLVFVLRDGEATQEFLPYLDRTFPGHRRVLLSAPTQGALMSALAGIPLLSDPEEPLCIDLVDVLYKGRLDPVLDFEQEPTLVGLIPYFESDDSPFSYLRMDDQLRVLETAEKRVISRAASAGTYFFRDVSTFLDACAGSATGSPTLHHRGLLFVCPAYNPLIQAGRWVRGAPVSQVEALSKDFHR